MAKLQRSAAALLCVGAAAALLSGAPTDSRAQVSQTAETNKPAGAIPYTTYLRRTGQTAPGEKARPAKPRPRPKPAVEGAATTAPAPAAAPAGTALQNPAPPSSPPITAAPAVTTAPAIAPATPPRPAQPQPAPPPAAAKPTARRLPTQAPIPPTPTPAGARLAPATAIPQAELEAFVDGAVRDAMTTDHLAGAAVVVVQDGQVVLEKGYGLARLRPAAPMDVQTTRFRLGGLSEVFTWLEVLKLVEAGRLDLDAPIDDVLPDRLKLGLEGFQKPVRLRHLMTHTAGFEARELGRLFKDDPRRLLGLETALRKQRSRRVREAGALASYSVYGAALAGAAAANVAGKPFDQLIESDLLAPAGLDATRFREPYPAESALPAPLPESAAQHFSDGFRWGGDGLDPQPFAYGQDFAPGLSASSTGRDMGRLMQLLLGAPTPWGPGVAAAPFTPMQSSGPGLPGWTYGLQQQPLAGGFAGFGHAGAAMSFRSRMLLAPQLRLGVFVVSNTDSGQTLVDRLPAAVIARFYAPPPSAAALGSPQPAIEAHRYAGLYLTTRRAYHGLEGLTARLTRATRVSVGPDGRLSVRSSGSTRQFTPAGPDRFVSLDGAQTLAFSAPPEHADAPARLMLDPAQAEAVVRESALHAPGLLVVGAGAAGLTALLCFAGAALRLQRDERATRGQTVANAVQMVAAACWLLAIGAGLVFLRQARDPEALMYQWPNLWLVSASCLALAATILGVAQIVQLRAVWERASRHHAWNTGRRLRHTLSVGVFAAFSTLLATWGALFPWTS